VLRVVGEAVAALKAARGQGSRHEQCGQVGPRRYGGGQDRTTAGRGGGGYGGARFHGVPAVRGTSGHGAA
jgi:hypothetical protein